MNRNFLTGAIIVGIVIGAILGFFDQNFAFWIIVGAIIGIIVGFAINKYDLTLTDPPDIAG